MQQKEPKPPKAASRNVVLLRKRPLPVAAPLIRSTNSTPSLRSNSSSRSNRPSPISKNVRPTKLEIPKPTPPWRDDIKIHGKLKRPITIFASSNVTKRGQTQASSKSEQQGRVVEELTRCSSVNNLNSEGKSKGAFSKLRKSGSKDKLDKLVEKKNDKEVSNNNKLNPVHDDDALELGILQKQLNEMAKERCDLVLELGERKEEVEVLKDEIVKLKEQSLVRIEQLSDENASLRNRLRDIAHSPLSDNEKQQLLLDTERHSSAPASIAANVGLLEDEHIADCPTPDWDKHSSSNVSEVSVACLQDKINQMQETHYSTNEELQATLQELTDLQKQLTELQQDNERLSDEKNLMFDSLCRQTERLNDARAEVESLKQLLYRDKDEGIADREEKLVVLLKTAQDERESLLLKQEQLGGELHEVRTINVERAAELEQMTERARTLESALDAKHAEHKLLDQELVVSKDQCSARQIEINRLTDLLENARTKIGELEQERALNDKSELDELLDNARKEKDALESEVAHLKEQVALSRNESDKLREQVSILQEECKVTRNNAKCTQSELEYKCEKLVVEKSNIAEQLQQLQDAANELQVQAQCQLEDKRQLSTVLSETQRNLSEAERRNNELEVEVDDLKKLRIDENEEWEKFQNDLLTSVRVANDFKSEAQQELQKMILENKSHRDRIRQLETQIDKLKDLPEAKVKTQNPDQSSFFGKLKFSYYGQKKSRSMDDIYLNQETLEDLYERIDFGKDEDEFTNEEKFVIKLKHSLDEMGRKTTLKKMSLKQKPRISEPVFTSVFANQKLMSVLSDPTVKSVYEMSGGSVRSSTEGSSNLDDFLETVFKLPQASEDSADFKHYDNFEDALADLRERLDEDEVQLVERIRENPEYGRPTSDIDENDLRIIGMAHARAADEARPVPFPRRGKHPADYAFDTLTTSSNHNYDSLQANESDSQSAFQNVRRKFESLIQAANFKGESKRPSTKKVNK